MKRLNEDRRKIRRRDIVWRKADDLALGKAGG